jgi:hypothetical protein
MAAEHSLQAVNGNVLCKFEIAWYKQLKQSHFMHKVWNNANPQKIGKNHTFFKTCLELNKVWIM